MPSHLSRAEPLGIVTVHPATRPLPKTTHSKPDSHSGAFARAALFQILKTCVHLPINILFNRYSTKIRAPKVAQVLASSQKQLLGENVLIGRKRGMGESGVPQNMQLFARDMYFLNTKGHPGKLFDTTCSIRTPHSLRTQTALSCVCPSFALVLIDSGGCPHVPQPSDVQ